MYYIKAITTFFREPDRRFLVMSENHPSAAAFATKAAAEERIEELDGQVYHQSHNEYGRPEYSVIHASKLPQYLKAYL